MPKKNNNKKFKNNINKNNNFHFFLTDAFGKEREHYALQISEDDNTWTFMVLTHTPSGHYRLQFDPITGKRTPQISYLNTSLRTKHKSTRLREDKVRHLSEEDKKYIEELIKKKKPH